MTKDEALRLALEAMELVIVDFVCKSAHHDKKDRHELFEPCPVVERYKQAITAIKEALARPAALGLIESLKDAQICCGEYETCWSACTPRGKFFGQRDAQRTWVGLTDEEANQLWESTDSDWELMKRTEAKLKEKNT